VPTNLLYWGGPVTGSQPNAVDWGAPTKIVTVGENGSEANASRAAALIQAGGGCGWKALAKKAGLAPEEVGSFGIAGFSAFHGAAREFSRSDCDFSRISYIHLADACFMGAGASKPYEALLRFARAAVDPGSGKLMVATTNGPWDQALHYSHAGTNYDLTSGAQCFRLIWNAATAGKSISTSVSLPPGLPAPTLAQRCGNLIWLHYEPKGSDSHGYHVHVLATPLMQWFGAPWMRGERPSSGLPIPVGMPTDLGSVLAGAAAAVLGFLGFRWFRRRRR